MSIGRQEFNFQRSALKLGKLDWPSGEPKRFPGGFLFARKEETMTNAVSILRLPAVRTRTGLSRSSLYLRISQGTFPPPISLGGRSVGWLSTDIDSWLSDRIAQSRTVPTARPASAPIRLGAPGSLPTGLVEPESGAGGHTGERTPQTHRRPMIAVRS